MKLKKKLLIISIIISIITLTIMPAILATNASLSFKASNETPYVGESVTVTANVVAGGFNLTLTGNGETKQIVGQTDKTDNVSKSESITFTPTEAKTYTFTLTGDYTDYNTDKETPVNKTITVTAKAKEETPSQQEEPKTTQEEPKNTEPSVTYKDVNETVYATTDVNVRSGPSTSSSSLGSLYKNKSTTRTGIGSNGWSRVRYNGGIAYIKSDYLTTTKPKEEEIFTDANETVYATTDVNVRKGPSTSDATLGRLEKGKSVIRTGVGNSGWSRVTYNNATAYINSDYLTTTAPENAEKEEKTENTSNANLKSLQVVGETLVPEFLPNVTSYTMKVSKDTQKLEVKAEAETAKATVSIKGNEELKDGENIITISVSAEDGTVKIYEIKVEKASTTAATLGLKELKIDGAINNINFKPETYNYEVQIEDAITKLDITATPNKEEATVEILGNEDFTEGENVITIIVSAKDSEEKVTYQIKAIKGNGSKGENEEKSKSIIDPDLKLYIYSGVFAVLLIALIIVVIYAIKHRKNDEDEDYDDNEEEIPDSLRKGSQGLYNQELDKDPIDETQINEEQIPNTKIDYNYEEQNDEIEQDEPKEHRRRHRRGRHF